VTDADFGPEMNPASQSAVPVNVSFSICVDGALGTNYGFGAILGGSGQASAAGHFSVPSPDSRQATIRFRSTPQTTVR
jgi:hypothetical protein